MVGEAKPTYKELSEAMNKLDEPKSQSGDTRKRGSVMRRILTSRNARRLQLKAQRKADDKRRGR